MEFKIEKDIPVGFTGHEHKYNGKYPLSKMDVGDSFVVSVEQTESIRATSAKYAKMTGTKFMTRKFEGGVRVWRIQ